MRALFEWILLISIVSFALRATHATIVKDASLRNIALQTSRKSNLFASEETEFRPTDIVFIDNKPQKSIEIVKRLAATKHASNLTVLHKDGVVSLDAFVKSEPKSQFRIAQNNKPINLYRIADMLRIKEVNYIRPTHMEIDGVSMPMSDVIDIYAKDLKRSIAVRYSNNEEYFFYENERMGATQLYNIIFERPNFVFDFSTIQLNGMKLPFISIMYTLAYMPNLLVVYDDQKMAPLDFLKLHPNFKGKLQLEFEGVIDNLVDVIKKTMKYTIADFITLPKAMVSPYHALQSLKHLPEIEAWRPGPKHRPRPLNIFLGDVFPDEDPKQNLIQVFHKGVLISVQNLVELLLGDGHIIFGDMSYAEKLPRDKNYSIRFGNESYTIDAFLTTYGRTSEYYQIMNGTRILTLKEAEHLKRESSRTTIRPIHPEITIASRLGVSFRFPEVAYNLAQQKPRHVMIVYQGKSYTPAQFVHIFRDHMPEAFTIQQNSVNVPLNDVFKLIDINITPQFLKMYRIMNVHFEGQIYTKDDILMAILENPQDFSILDNGQFRTPHNFKEHYGDNVPEYVIYYKDKPVVPDEIPKILKLDTILEEEFYPILYNGNTYTPVEVVEMLFNQQPDKTKILHKEKEYTPEEYKESFPSTKFQVLYNDYPIKTEDLEQIIDFDLKFPKSKLRFYTIKYKGVEYTKESILDILIEQAPPNLKILHEGVFYLPKQFKRKFGKNLPGNFAVVQNRRIIPSKLLPTIVKLGDSKQTNPKIFPNIFFGGKEYTPDDILHLVISQNPPDVTIALRNKKFTPMQFEKVYDGVYPITFSLLFKNVVMTPEEIVNIVDFEKVETTEPPKVIIYTTQKDHKWMPTTSTERSTTTEDSIADITKPDMDHRTRNFEEDDFTLGRTGTKAEVYSSGESNEEPTAPVTPEWATTPKPSDYYADLPNHPIGGQKPEDLNIRVVDIGPSEKFDKVKEFPYIIHEGTLYSPSDVVRSLAQMIARKIMTMKWSIYYQGKEYIPGEFVKMFKIVPRDFAIFRNDKKINPEQIFQFIRLRNYGFMITEEDKNGKIFPHLVVNGVIYTPQHVLHCLIHQAPNETYILHQGRTYHPSSFKDELGEKPIPDFEIVIRNEAIPKEKLPDLVDLQKPSFLTTVRPPQPETTLITPTTPNPRGFSKEGDDMSTTTSKNLEIIVRHEETTTIKDATPSTTTELPVQFPYIVYNGSIFSPYEVVRTLKDQNPNNVSIVADKMEFTPEEFYKHYIKDSPENFDIYQNGKYIPPTDIPKLVNFDEINYKGYDYDYDDKAKSTKNSGITATPQSVPAKHTISPGIIKQILKDNPSTRVVIDGREYEPEEIENLDNLELAQNDIRIVDKENAEYTLPATSERPLEMEPTKQSLKPQYEEVLTKLLERPNGKDITVIRNDHVYPIDTFLEKFHGKIPEDIRLVDHGVEFPIPLMEEHIKRSATRKPELRKTEDTNEEVSNETTFAPSFIKPSTPKPGSNRVVIYKTPQSSERVKEDPTKLEFITTPKLGDNDSFSFDDFTDKPEKNDDDQNMTYEEIRREDTPPKTSNETKIPPTEVFITHPVTTNPTGNRVVINSNEVTHKPTQQASTPKTLVDEGDTTTPAINESNDALFMTQKPIKPIGTDDDRIVVVEEPNNPFTSVVHPTKPTLIPDDLKNTLTTTEKTRRTSEDDDVTDNKPNTTEPTHVISTTYPSTTTKLGENYDDVEYTPEPSVPRKPDDRIVIETGSTPSSKFESNNEYTTRGPTRPPTGKDQRIVEVETPTISLEENVFTELPTGNPDVDYKHSKSEERTDVPSYVSQTTKRPSSHDGSIDYFTDKPIWQTRRPTRLREKNDDRFVIYEEPSKENMRWDAGPNFDIYEPPTKYRIPVQTTKTPKPSRIVDTADSPVHPFRTLEPEVYPIEVPEPTRPIPRPRPTDGTEPLEYLEVIRDEPTEIYLNIPEKPLIEVKPTIFPSLPIEDYITDKSPEKPRKPMEPKIKAINESETTQPTQPPFDILEGTLWPSKPRQRPTHKPESFESLEITEPSFVTPKPTTIFNRPELQDIQITASEPTQPSQPQFDKSIEILKLLKPRPSPTHGPEFLESIEIVRDEPAQSHFDVDLRPISATILPSQTVHGNFNEKPTWRPKLVQPEPKYHEPAESVLVSDNKPGPDLAKPRTTPDLVVIYDDIDHPVTRPGIPRKTEKPKALVDVPETSQQPFKPTKPENDNDDKPQSIPPLFDILAKPSKPLRPSRPTHGTQFPEDLDIIRSEKPPFSMPDNTDIYEPTWPSQPNRPPIEPDWYTERTKPLTPYMEESQRPIMPDEYQTISYSDVYSTHLPPNRPNQPDVTFTTTEASVTEHQRPSHPSGHRLVDFGPKSSETFPSGITREPVIQSTMPNYRINNVPKNTIDHKKIIEDLSKHNPAGVDITYNGKVYSPKEFLEVFPELPTYPEFLYNIDGEPSPPEWVAKTAQRPKTTARSYKQEKDIQPTMEMTTVKPPHKHDLLIIDDNVFDEMDIIRNLAVYNPDEIRVISYGKPYTPEEFIKTFPNLPSDMDIEYTINGNRVPPYVVVSKIPSRPKLQPNITFPDVIKDGVTYTPKDVMRELAKDPDGQCVEVIYDGQLYTPRQFYNLFEDRASFPNHFQMQVSGKVLDPKIFLSIFKVLDKNGAVVKKDQLEDNYRATPTSKLSVPTTRKPNVVLTYIRKVRTKDPNFEIVYRGEAYTPQEYIDTFGANPPGKFDIIYQDQVMSPKAFYKHLKSKFINQGGSSSSTSASLEERDASNSFPTIAFEGEQFTPRLVLENLAVHNPNRVKVRYQEETYSPMQMIARFEETPLNFDLVAEDGNTINPLEPWRYLKQNYSSGRKSMAIESKKFPVLIFNGRKYTPRDVLQNIRRQNGRVSVRLRNGREVSIAQALAMKPFSEEFDLISDGRKIEPTQIARIIQLK